MRRRWLGLGSVVLSLLLGCTEASSEGPAAQRAASPERPRRRSTYAERVKQGQDLKRLTPRRKALFRALSLQDPQEQREETQRELARLRQEKVLFALRRHDASAPLTLREAESLREGIRTERGQPTLAVVIELRLGIENELPLQIVARQLYRPTYELLVEHLRGEP